jgi:hypothetical protein
MQSGEADDGANDGTACGNACVCGLVSLRGYVDMEVKMSKYFMQWETLIGGLQWEYQFTQPSDEMAIEYAKRYAAMIDSDRCQGLLLVHLQTARVVARIKIRQTVQVTVEMP